MSQKEIKLYDDSVIKLTIKQGNESERFPVTNIASGGNSKLGTETINLLEYDEVSSISGSFSSGELAYTRDTNRLFVGNLSEDFIINGEAVQQQTLGGTLTGNKYLGYVDSRLDVKSANYSKLTSTQRGKAIDLSNLLTQNSIYRSYNFASTNGGIEYTEDKKWQRLSYYNPKYDAYDGDYMYDIYRNALILFDHNIKPNDGTTSGASTIGGKRKTPLQARWKEEGSLSSKPSKEEVYSYTTDMYGDGYVLLYNVIPDGDTLCFEDRGFDGSGKSDSANGTADNYSYNVIKLNRIPVDKLFDLLDKTQFVKNSEGIITLANGSSGSGNTGGGNTGGGNTGSGSTETNTNISITDKTISRIIINENEILCQSTIDPDAISSILDEISGAECDSLASYINDVVSSSIDGLDSRLTDVEKEITVNLDDKITSIVDTATYKIEKKVDDAAKELEESKSNLESTIRQVIGLPRYTQNYKLFDASGINAAGLDEINSTVGSNGSLIKKDESLQVVIENTKTPKYLLIPEGSQTNNYYLLLGITGTYKMGEWYQNDIANDGIEEEMLECGKSSSFSQVIIPCNATDGLKVILDSGSSFNRIAIIDTVFNA